MIDADHRTPANGVMAGFTARTGKYVTGRFTGCIGSIVAANAVPANARVIDACCLPGNRVMTEVTLCAGLQMARVFAGGNAAIMAAGTGAPDFIVIYPCYGRPHRGAVAGFTQAAGLNVRAVFTRGRGAIVAGAAATIYCGMVNDCYR